MYFESHAHYDDKRYKDDRDELLETLPKQGIKYVINIGADMKSSKASIELAEKYDYIYASVGVHPSEVESLSDKDIETLEEYSKHDKVVAIGEIGLDYYYDTPAKEIQIQWFERQLKLAEKVNLPVVIHSRDACQETLDIIKRSNVRKGVIHCFSSSKEIALEYVKMGFFIGIGGVVTFSNAKKLVETVSAIDLDNILLETDCPYLSPAPNRGKRNDSQNLTFISQKIAQIKQIPNEKVAKTTFENAVALFCHK